MDNDTRTKAFDLRKYKLTIPDPKEPLRRVPLESFELREITGDDIIAAAERAGPGGVGASIKDGMIAESFVSVNGEPVPQPFVGWRKWPAKARDYVMTAYTRMNDATAADLADFEKAAFGG